MRHWLLLALLGCCWVGLAQAEIYKSVDAEGRVTYSSSPTKGARKLNLERLPAASPPPRARNNPTPADFPRVDSGTQKNRDNTRRKILQDELAAEEKMLSEARFNLRYAVENPAVYDRDGNTVLNVPEHQQKLDTLQKEVALHEKNIEALKTELLK